MGGTHLFSKCQGLVMAFAAWLLVVAAPATATATFTPRMCSQCPSMTEVAWTFNSDELPTDPNCAGGTCPHYINHLHYWRSVIANGNVKRFQFRVDSFNTEASNDWLDYSAYLASPIRLTGQPTTGWKDFTSATSLQHRPMEFLFHTDSSVSRPGFRIGRARVCCNSDAWPPVPDFPLRQTMRHTGVLLATHDVVYMHMPTGPSNRFQNLAMWGPAGADFDMYVRCNAVPTATTYDFRVNSAGTQEFTSWAQPGLCTYPGTWYIAIHSVSGSGQFNLVASPVFNTHYLYINAGVNFLATPTQLNTFANTLSQGARQFYGQTEGQILFAAIHLWNNAGPPGGGGNCNNCNGGACNVCFRNEPGTGYCCDPGGMVVMQTGYWGDPEGMAHEWSHWGLGVPDEYSGCATGCKWHCGHSNMASPWGSQNNHCFFHQNQHDHGEDRSAGVGPPGSNAVWKIVESYGTVVPLSQWSETPDNYDYRNHDMNGFSNVVVHNP